MDKLELRARARAAARASGLLEIAPETTYETRNETRSRSSAARARPAAPNAIDVLDEAQARAACKPMGELEYIVQAADASGRTRALYVIVPDLALSSHYRRLGFEVHAGCRVLLDAEALLPLAVLRILARNGEDTPSRCAPSAGFNPYFDIPSI